jgi:hypothetical protein
MVDAEDLPFGEDMAERVVDRIGAGAVGANRLLDHHAGVGVDQLPRIQPLRRLREQLRRHREVEHAHALLAAHRGAELLPAAVAGQVQALVAQQLEEIGQRRAPPLALCSPMPCSAARTCSR